MVNFDKWSANPELEVVEYFGSLSGSVLDVGCGDGRYANLFDDYTGIDPAPGAIKRAKEKDNKDFRVCPIEDFVPDRVYDHVITSVALGQIDVIPTKIKAWGKKLHMVESPEDKHDYRKLFNVVDEKALNCRVVIYHHINKFYSRGKWFDPEDFLEFSKLELPDKPVILELGTGSGRSSIAMRELWPDADITTCDPIDKGIAQEGYKEMNIDVPASFINDFGFNLKWDRPLDFLFIDDDHEYKTVKRDIEKYKEFIKPGGYIVCHDYYETGVEQAVNELLPDAVPVKTGDYSQAKWRKK